jgi:hypothetical protein
VWRICQAVYKRVGAPTWHIDHEHDKRKDRHKSLMRKRWEMRSDIRTNNCKQIYRQVMKEND